MLGPHPHRSISSTPISFTQGCIRPSYTDTNGAGNVGSAGLAGGAVGAGDAGGLGEDAVAAGALQGVDLELGVLVVETRA